EPYWNIKLVHFEPDQRYVLDDFHAFEDKSEPVEAASEVSERPIEDPGIEWLKRQHKDVMTVSLTQLLSQRHGDRSKALWRIYHECHRLGIPMEHCFWLCKSSPNNKFADSKYNSDEQLWRDVAAGYAAAERRVHDRGILATLDGIRAEKDSAA